MGRISPRNRVTLPAAELAAGGLHPGDEVQIRALGPGRLEIIGCGDVVAEFAGICDAEDYPPGYLPAMRDAWH
jgi:hypothetical protein